MRNTLPLPSGVAPTPALWGPTQQTKPACSAERQGRGPYAAKVGEPLAIFEGGAA